MRYWLTIFLLLFLTTTTHAEELQPLAVVDQWGKAQVLNSETQLLIFSHHKEGSGWVKQALQVMGITNMEEKHWLYVADISSMPKMITKLFAVPKMRDYAFPIALARDEKTLQEWPKKEGFVAIYSLNNLFIESMVYFNTSDTIRLHLESKLQNDGS